MEHPRSYVLSKLGARVGERAVPLFIHPKVVLAKGLFARQTTLRLYVCMGFERASGRALFPIQINHLTVPLLQPLLVSTFSLSIEVQHLYLISY